jgi:hypothetical protein
MKDIGSKILSITLAFIVLFSSFSFTVNKHFCGGEVVNTTLFVDADNCGMDMTVCENDSSTFDVSKTVIKKEPCCENTSEIIQGSKIEQQSIQALELPQIQFLTAFVYTYINNFKETTSVSEFVTYKPPLVGKDIQILFQVFRI